MSGFVKIPTKVFELRQANPPVISSAQFEILVCGYAWMDWPTHRVAAYSAHRVCEFYGLKSTKANLRRYQRAALDLVTRGLIRRNYQRLNPGRGDQERCYSIWVMSESQWEEWAIAFAQVNSFSIGIPHVTQNASDSVALHKEGSTEVAESYACEENDSVAVNESDIGDSLSTTKKNIPLVPQGGIPPSPASLREGRSSGAGLFEPSPLTPLKGESLPSVGAGLADKAKRIQAAALKYAKFCDWLWGFTPNENHVAAILSEFSPRSLAAVQMEKFPRKYRKNDMAYFFWRGAMTLLQAQGDNSMLDIPSQRDKEGVSFQDRFGRYREEVLSKIDELQDCWERSFWIQSAWSAEDEMEDVDPDPRWAEVLDEAAAVDSNVEPSDLA